MTKKVIIFDLDQTLSETRSPMTDEMARLIDKLLEKFVVCVISGGNFNQFELQLMSNLKVHKKLLKNLHIMPACGSRYYKFNYSNNNWDEIYAENLTEKNKKIIIKALNEGIKEADFQFKNAKGPLIEDRGSQITYSALGQDAQPKEKLAWDPSSKKKQKIRNIVAKKIPQFEVKMGGTTSIDVTNKGVNKAYGMKKLMKLINCKKSEMLFIGDRVFEGGNDFPVFQMGIDCINVSGFKETPEVVRKILSGELGKLKLVK